MAKIESKSNGFQKLVAFIILLIGLFFIFLDVIAIIHKQITNVTTSSMLGIDLIIQSVLIWKGFIPNFKGSDN